MDRSSDPGRCVVVVVALNLDWLGSNASLKQFWWDSSAVSWSTSSLSLLMDGSGKKEGVFCAATTQLSNAGCWVGLTGPAQRSLGVVWADTWEWGIGHRTVGCEEEARGGRCSGSASGAAVQLLF